MALRRHRDDLIDLALLWLSLQAPGWIDDRMGVPAVAQVVAMLAAAFCLPRKPAPPLAPGRRALARLPGKLLALAGSAAVFLLWFGFPARSLAFAPVWIGLLLGRPPAEAAVRRAARWPWGARLRAAGAAAQRLSRGCRLDLFAGAALIVGGGGWIASKLVTPGMPGGWTAAGLGLAGLLIVYALALRRAARRQGDSYAENLRWIALAAGAGWLLHRYATRAQYGTDDARWYATMLADFRAQIRAGVLPVSIGQSPWQFNGAVFSFRIAPAYHYLGALLDQLTLRTLEPYALQHLLLLGIGAVALFSAYACLASLLPERRWTAAALAWLWLVCPGVAGIVFNTDLYMTWTTLPAVPWIVLGWVRIWSESEEPAGWLNLGLGLGWAWWGHTPMAVWLSFFTGTLGAAWLAARRPGPVRLARAAGGAALCLGLAAFPAASYLTAIRRIGLGPQGFSATSPGTIYYFVQQAFPSVLLPVSARGRQLGDFQLGWALWAGLALTAAQAVRSRRAGLVALATIGGLVVVLLTPVPHLTYPIWRMLPAFIRDATTNWAMNRLYLILASVAAVGAAAALGGAGRPAPRWALVATALLLWSTREAGKFSRLAPIDDGSDAAQMLPENTAITRNAYVVFPKIPAYFSEGVVNPALENRLTDADGRPFLTNADAAAVAARTVWIGGFRVVGDSGARFLELGKPLRLEPGWSYLVEFDYQSPKWAGVLQLSGPSLFRQYAMPDYGGPASFGAGGEHSRLLPLSTSGAQPENIRVRFLPKNPEALPGPGLPAWATVRLLAYDPSHLPIRVASWVPYRAWVSSPRASWLETPRVFQQGYRAKVNGAPSPVRGSPQGLAMLPVPRGESTVELRYDPGALYVAAFWFSLTGWIAVAGWGAWRALSSRRPPPAGSV